MVDEHENGHLSFICKGSILSRLNGTKIRNANTWYYRTLHGLDIHRNKTIIWMKWKQKYWNRFACWAKNVRLSFEFRIELNFVFFFCGTCIHNFCLFPRMKSLQSTKNSIYIKPKRERVKSIINEMDAIETDWNVSRIPNNQNN